MLENLLLKTGINNIVSISKKATTDTTLTGTTPQTKTLETLSIDLTNINDSILLTGVIDFSITDEETATATNIGPLELEVLRTFNGNTTPILFQNFVMNSVEYLAGIGSFQHFKFHWLDLNPTSSLCSNTCTNLSDNCSAANITYTFNLSTTGLGSATQSAGVVAEDYYSLNLIEIPKQV
ncbi:hypothetical protein [Clostridium botulinum]|uniref:Uncharacterized protein n=1 Tax=Clostridium botulinum TaxID=1491 RepID=A0A9Q1ZB17_CLOBO|nr:hypothetical protein [Clostridium botulinum]AEB75658.1 hypothetical protein CbC4_0978 [Clostridium botulinum BKT015925]KEI00821.1 hypothetical protein Y848_10505 [Clostridium botulinum C/D str. Sp77]KEI02160.1 hypothetical protein Z953_07880 [Clostridium botulinum D str. 16868]KLU76440.1 hypothetical protein CBC3_03845 [Clostridium botulinum V891]KOA78829.1 hypothetical protein ADU78_00730 [Clostridium botulinum]